MNEIIMKISDLTGISIEDIVSKKRTVDVCQARQIFIYIAFNKYYISRPSIAKYLNRSPQAISQHLKTFNSRLKTYKGLQFKVKSLEDQLVS